MAAMLGEGTRHDRLFAAAAEQRDAPHLGEDVRLDLYKLNDRLAGLIPNQGYVVERLTPDARKLCVPEHLDAEPSADVVLVQKSGTSHRPPLFEGRQVVD
jgi:hypothetical protein